jgi:hypothetical protein
MPSMPRAERFWRHVDKSGECWNWTGAPHCERPGLMPYGTFTDYVQRSDPDRRARSAHRVAYELAHGEIPEGMMVLHHCDNPRCVRPDHLYAGTRRQNMDDVIARKRQAGERNPQALLTAEKVREIRASSDSPAQLAERFGVARPTIYNIRNRYTWRHVVE